MAITIGTPGIVMREIDCSSRVSNHSTPISMIVPSAKGPAVKPRVIGKFPLKRYYGMSHRRKVELKAAFNRGDVQQAEFLKIFGQPDFSSAPYGALAEAAEPGSKLYVVRVPQENEDE